MPPDLKLLGQKLQRYRTQLQLTIGEVSAGTAIPVASLEEYEGGRRGPSGDELLILADFFRCDYKDLVSADKLTPLDRTETLFRRFGDAFNKADRRAVQDFMFLCECEEYLETTVGQPRRTDKFVAKKTGNYYKKHAEDGASDLRKFLNYKSYEVPRDIYQDFRQLGMHLFRRKLENSNISGVYLNHPHAGDCILINYSEDIYRQRFTAAHETAHALFDREEEIVVSFWNAGELQEVRANNFASHFLMPPDFLSQIPDSKSWDSAKLLMWADNLRVNQEPLIIALSNSGLIDRSTADDLKRSKTKVTNKSDPELPSTLSPLSKERKSHLLERGLSSHYVTLCFEAFRRHVVTSSRLVELLLLDGDRELMELADLYKERLDDAS
jgi:Zn-dependent peptidase ImmA (M78 family)